MKDVFEKIYADNAWEKGSGYGSLSEQTEPYRCYLQSFMRREKVKSVLDIGCGDWQLGRLIDWSGIWYTGVDVVESVIQRNKELFGSSGDKGLVGFFAADITTLTGFDYHDGKGFDLILIKDVFQHWPNQTILDFLPKLKDAKRVLITNCEGRNNYDIQTGDFRPLDLQRKPFKLPTTVVLRYGSKRVDLWEPQKGV